MISGPFVRALEDLGDYGLVGDVICYRGLTAEHCCLTALRQEVEALEDFTCQRRARFISASQALGVREATIRRRLIAANAQERVAHLMGQEDELGELSWRHRRTLRRDYSGAY
jgi:hypothetical protein